MTVPAGNLNRTLVFKRLVHTKDGTGGSNHVPTVIATVRAEVRPTGGRDALLGGVPRASQAFRIRVRASIARYGIKAGDFALWGTRVLRMTTGFEDPDGLNRDLIAYAEEGVPADLEGMAGA